MSRLQKEMKVLSRNNIERQKLSNQIVDLNVRQVKCLERSTHGIRSISDDLQKFQQSSGKSKTGVACSRREASELIHHSCSEILKARWQVSLRSTDTSEVNVSTNIPLPAIPRLQSRQSTEEKTVVKLTPNSPQLVESSSSDPVANRPRLSRSHSVPIFVRSHRVAFADPGASLKLPERGSDHIGNVHHMDEFERQSVRRTTVIVNPENAEDGKDSIRYIRPHERHRYDIVTSRRLAFLKRSFPADTTAGIDNHMLSSGAFSTNSRKSALCLLVEMNNKKIERSMKIKPDLALQKKLEDFLKSMDDS